MLFNQNLIPFFHAVLSYLHNSWPGKQLAYLLLSFLLLGLRRINTTKRLLSPQRRYFPSLVQPAHTRLLESPPDIRIFL